MTEHDAHLRGLLKRHSDHGVTLNPAKCEFHQTIIHFLGHNMFPAGIKALSTKVDALFHFPIPENMTELRRSIGMAQQLSKFTPKLARASEPLRDLLSTKNSWVWTDNHEVLFQKAKQALTKAPILAHYDVNKLTKLCTDGSLINGIANVLYQQNGNLWNQLNLLHDISPMLRKTIITLKLKCLLSRGLVKRCQYISMASLTLSYKRITSP